MTSTGAADRRNVKSRTLGRQVAARVMTVGSTPDRAESAGGVAPRACERQEVRRSSKEFLGALHSVRASGRVRVKGDFDRSLVALRACPRAAGELSRGLDSFLTLDRILSKVPCGWEFPSTCRARERQAHRGTPRSFLG
jgi:hypothetical protein